MKKYFKMFGILFLVLVLTGCYKLDTKMQINEDKSMKFEMVYAVDVKALGVESDEEPMDLSEWEENAGAKDFKVLGYDEVDGDKHWKGIRVSKDYANIDDLVEDESHVVYMTSGVEENDISFNEKYFSKNGDNYVANFVYDFSSNDTEDVDLKEIQNAVSLNYSVVLPAGAVSHNADEVSEDGKTLTWNLKVGSINEIKYEFNIPQKSADAFVSSLPDWAIPVGIGGAVVISAIIVAVVLLNKKKNQ